MKCEHCHKENRAIAKYCRWCGKALASENVLGQIVGLDEVKQQLKTVVNTYMYLHSRKDIANVKLSVNAIIMGETGTGKTMLADFIRDYFFQNKILSKQKVTIVDAVDYKRFVDDWDENIKKAKGGLLFFDNVQKLLPDRYSNQVTPLDKLFVEIDHWNDDPIVVISGLTKGLDDFLNNNPAITNRFKYKFFLPTPGFMELYQICRQQLKLKYGITTYSPEAEKKLKAYFKYKVKTKDETFGYAHEAVTMAENIFTSFISRGMTAVVEEEDIKGYVPEERQLDDILSDMDKFIGMTEVKKAVREIAYSVKNAMERQGRGLGGGEKMGMHVVLTGNPGTGKTTIARKLGEILSAIEYLDSGHVVEVDRSKMVSPYQGETPKVVNRLCDKAKGGILFVDEAYTLAPINQSGERDQSGAEALETLMKRMEDDRGEFVVITAGYRMEMDNLFRINPGFRSRFNYFLNIEDYNPEELFEILLTFAQAKKYIISPAAEGIIKTVIHDKYETRDKDFANGRTMRQLFDTICKRQAERLQANDIRQTSDEELMTILPEDVPYEKPKTVDYRECLTELNGLVGLKGVKDEISNLASYLNLQIQRGENNNTFQGKHYIFTGNPGTGKTTVARIMAKVFKTLGILSRGHLVEADRAKLVAGYSGQTAIKTNQLVDSAIGGVLFIDEAYTLASSDHDSFGSEAIDTLLKRLEDDRGKFICIVAGYTQQMHDFIDSNPGLKSRFTQTINFEDYTPEELTQIFLNMASARKFTMADDVKDAVKRMFDQIYLRRDRNFGNAREARRLFDETVENQSHRLVESMGKQPLQESDMFAILASDLPSKKGQAVRPIDEVLNDMDEFIGMRSVKNLIRRLAVQSMFMKQRSESGIGSVQQMTMNFVLTGNPGTGKTSVSRLMGELLQSMEILPTKHIVEASRATMVGKYMGETPQLVNKLCDQALGGVLFVDEAYNLCAGDDRYGQEAVDTLMKRMEDDRGKFVVIVAGYKDRMDAFLNTNPGLSSRFTHRLHIEDYNEDELVSIFKKMASKQDYQLSQDAEFKLMGEVCKMVMNKKESFGNAREMRNMLDTTIGRLSMRVAKMPPHALTADSYKVIMPEDIPTGGVSSTYY